MAHQADIHITKLEAARRQLCAAIRMYFSAEDELAIHTVASAAYGIIRDLKAQRNRDEVGDNFLTSIFYAVQEYKTGKLPSYLANNPEFMKWISETAQQLPITESTKFDDVKVQASSDTKKEFWRKRNKVSNFLKHADRDSSAHISVGEIDNLFLLMQVQSSYCDVAQHSSLGAEGLVLWIYFTVELEVVEGMPKKFEDIARNLENLSREERLEFCSIWLDEIKDSI